jgi:hypothetical protein
MKKAIYIFFISIYSGIAKDLPKKLLQKWQNGVRGWLNQNQKSRLLVLLL